MSGLGEFCPICKGAIPENHIARSPDPDPHGEPSTRTFTFCSVCEQIFLSPRSYGFSERYTFEAELPAPLTESALELLTRVQEKILEPEGSWEHEVDFLSELRTGEISEEDVLEVIVEGLTLSLTINQFHTSWQCTEDELGNLGLDVDTPISELVEQVLNYFYETYASDVYIDSADALVEDLNGVSISGTHLSFTCTGWESGD